MSIITNILVTFVIILHIYFLILEMFFWTTPKGIKAFGLESKDFAEKTKVLAANQGLYNGFLAAGLIAGLVLDDFNFIYFFLTSVIIAGIYGAYSTKQIRLFYFQSVPAILALISILLHV